MKRRRPLLFDVLGNRRHAETRAPRGGRAEPARPARAVEVRPRPDLRVSREFGVVLALVAVVFVGGSYYLGTLHGRSGSAGRLARQESVGTAEAEGTAPDSGRVWAVQVCTRYWKRESELPEVVQRIAKVVEFLKGQGFPEVQVHRDLGRKRFEVYVGRGGEDSLPGLRALVTRLQTLTFEGRRDFAAAFPKDITEALARGAN